MLQVCAYSVYVFISAYLCIHAEHSHVTLAEGYDIVNWRLINLMNIPCELQIHPANHNMVEYLFDHNLIHL